jgi:hypothetical protein
MPFGGRILLTTGTTARRPGKSDASVLLPH